MPQAQGACPDLPEAEADGLTAVYKFELPSTWVPKVLILPATL
jgi:hypothetical protein